MPRRKLWAARRGGDKLSVMTEHQIEYFYSSHSAYAYIGAQRLMEIAARFDCKVIHRPFELSPAVEKSGAPPFAGRTQAHVDYYFGREIERWAAYRGVPIVNHRPTHHDQPLVLSSGMLIAAGLAGLDQNALSHAILKAHWAEDIDLMDKAALSKAAHSVGVDPAPLLARALSDEVSQIYAANTAEAIARNVFGSPTYFLDGDMYYGQDHLDLMAHAMTTPFPPHTFRNPSVG